MRLEKGREGVEGEGDCPFIDGHPQICLLDGVSALTSVESRGPGGQTAGQGG